MIKSEAIMFYLMDRYTYKSTNLISIILHFPNSNCIFLSQLKSFIFFYFFRCALFLAVTEITTKISCDKKQSELGRRKIILIRIIDNMIHQFLNSGKFSLNKKNGWLWWTSLILPRGGTVEESKFSITKYFSLTIASAFSSMMNMSHS